MNLSVLADPQWWCNLAGTVAGLVGGLLCVGVTIVGIVQVFRTWIFRR